MKLPGGCANNFKGIFGMNISQLTEHAPSWTIVLIVSLPGTVVLFIFIYFGKFFWTWVSGRARSGGDLRSSAYFVGDKRDPESRTFSSINSFQGTFVTDSNIVA